MSFESIDESGIKSKLMAKISDQAKELQESAQYTETLRCKIEELENSLYGSSSGIKMNIENISPPQGNLSAAALQRKIERQHKEQIDALHKLLETAEQRLADSNKSKAKLASDIEAIGRESRFHAKKCAELQKDNQKLRAQLESTVRVASKDDKTFGSFSSKTTSTKQAMAMREELSRVKTELDRALRDLDLSRAREHELTMKARVLEDALEYRVEEVGLAGQADLLAKVAAMRGETAALKAELGEKREKLNVFEQDKFEMGRSHESLQRQISLMQQRLAMSQGEMNRLQSNDIVAQLKVAEQERDVLLEFVQGDMEKSCDLSKQIDKLESELRLANQSERMLQQRTSFAEEALDREMAKSSGLGDQLSDLESKIGEIKRANDMLKSENQHLVAQLERRGLEAEEMSKIQATLLSQMKGRDSALSTVEDELRSAKARLHELELTSPSLQADNAALRQRLRAREDELSMLRDGMSAIEPKVAVLEPEVTRLRKEQNEWLEERARMQAELAQLRPVDQTVGELEEALSQMKPLGSSSGYSSSSRRRGRSRDRAGGSGIGSRSAGQQSGEDRDRDSGRGKEEEDDDITLSQQHAGWIGVPSLRQLSPKLYDCVRSMFHDLNRKENHCRELEGINASLRREMDTTNQSAENECGRMAQNVDSLQRDLSEYRGRLAESEAELVRTRAARMTLEQIRLVLPSFPGGLEALSAQVPPPAAAAAAAGVDAGGPDWQAHSGWQGDSSQSYAPRSQSSSNSNSATTAAGSSSRFPSALSFPIRTEEDLQKLPDQLLPDLIGRALMHNASAVVSLQDAIARHTELRTELLTVQHKLSSASSENEELRAALAHLDEASREAEAEFAKKEGQLQRELDSAVELAEKQNALTITLESKLEGLKREKQLKSAQVTSMQQREEAMKIRLHATLVESGQRLGMPLQQLPAEAAKLADLIQYTVEMLSRLVHANALQAAKARYPLSRDSDRESYPGSGQNALRGGGAGMGPGGSLMPQQHDRFSGSEIFDSNQRHFQPAPSSADFQEGGASRTRSVSTSDVGGWSGGGGVPRSSLQGRVNRGVLRSSSPPLQQSVASQIAGLGASSVGKASRDRDRERGASAVLHRADISAPIGPTAGDSGGGSGTASAVSMGPSLQLQERLRLASLSFAALRE